MCCQRHANIRARAHAIWFKDTICPSFDRERRAICVTYLVRVESDSARSMYLQQSAVRPRTPLRIGAGNLQLNSHALGALPMARVPRRIPEDARSSQLYVGG